MRIVAISDTHTKHSLLTIPECDVLIHAGDFSFDGDFFEVLPFAEWLKRQPAKRKIVIAGNHEITFDLNHRKYNPSVKDMIARCLDDDSITYLENSFVDIEGVRFYGTPWTPWFYDWAFNGWPPSKDNAKRLGIDITEDGGPSIREIYEQINRKTQVLICHGPPNGVCDRAQDDRCGSEDLLNIIKATPAIKLVICGHIHEARGQGMIGDTHVCNVSSLGRDYKTPQPPVVIELDERSGEVLYIEGY